MQGRLGPFPHLHAGEHDRSSARQGHALLPVFLWHVFLHRQAGGSASGKVSSIFQIQFRSILTFTVTELLRACELLSNFDDLRLVSHD